MKLHIHFILLNSEFNQGLADDLNKGEETEDNIKQLWEDELVVSEPIKEFKIKHNQTYALQGLYANDEKFNFEITDMTIAECIDVKGNVTQFAVSKKLIKDTNKTVDTDINETHFYFYLKDKMPHVNPMNGVYIIKKDFPLALQKK
jgi:hypothetical protein